MLRWTGLHRVDRGNKETLVQDKCQLTYKIGEKWYITKDRTYTCASDIKQCGIFIPRNFQKQMSSLSLKWSNLLRHFGTLSLSFYLCSNSFAETQRYDGVGIFVVGCAGHWVAAFPDSSSSSASVPMVPLPTDAPVPKKDLRRGARK